jgi:hypothetical protein
MFLSANPKANQEWELEERFRSFETAQQPDGGRVQRR